MNLLPFNSVTTCPACGQSTRGLSVKFSDHRVVYAGQGRFVDVQTATDDLAPHLEKNCPHCDYGWLEECAPLESAPRDNIQPLSRR